MATDQPYPWPVFRARLRQAGYREQAPTSDARRYDGEACRADACPCGHQGLLYRPFTSVEPDGQVTYRAFALCPVCGRYEEF